MSEGVQVALFGAAFLVVGYFLYQQQETTQILLAKAVQPQQQSLLGELGALAGLVKTAVAFL